MLKNLVDQAHVSFGTLSCLKIWRCEKPAGWMFFLPISTSLSTNVSFHLKHIPWDVVFSWLDKWIFRLQIHQTTVFMPAHSMEVCQDIRTPVVDPELGVPNSRGRDDATTLKARCQLAHILALHGDETRHRQAEAHLREVVSRREQKLGPSHPETLTALGRLAFVLECNNPREAEQLPWFV